MSHELSQPGENRIADRLGHIAPEILIVAIMAVIVVGLHPLPGPFAYTVPLALLIVVLVSWLLLRRHDRRLCERCLAAMPLNPSQQATRYRRRFQLAHIGSEPRRLIPYLIVLIGSNFAPGPAGRIFWAVVQTSMVYLILSYSTHRRLQPWCPLCSDGGGGSEREDPVAPDPNPSDHRQLV
jgi:hypothetical protein